MSEESLVEEGKRWLRARKKLRAVAATQAGESLDDKARHGQEVMAAEVEEQSAGRFVQAAREEKVRAGSARKATRTPASN